MATATKRTPAKKQQLTGAGSRLRRRDYGKNHVYYLMMPDGTERKLDGVTTLLNDGLPKPALMNWAGNITAEKMVDNWDMLAGLPISKRIEWGKKARFDDRDTAGAKGTLIHKLAEHIIQGEEVEVPDEVRGHVESAVRFMDEYRIHPLLTETSVAHSAYGYGGTLDMVFTSDLPAHAGKVILGDWKTSRSGIYDEAALQLSAYKNAEFYLGPDGVDHLMTGLGITDSWGVWIRSDGYDVYPLDTGDDTFLFFRYISTVARRARALRDDSLKGAPLTRPVGGDAQ